VMVFDLQPWKTTLMPGIGVLGGSMLVLRADVNRLERLSTLKSVDSAGTGQTG